MAQIAALHKLVPELEEEGLINENDPNPLCFDGQKSLNRGGSDHLGYIDTYQVQGNKLCVLFHNERTGHEHEYCSSNADPYYIKPAKCVHKKGGMRRVNRSITKRLKRSARRRTRQRGGAHCRVKVGNTTMEGDSEEMCKTLRELAKPSSHKTRNAHHKNHSTINPLHAALGRR